MRFWSRIQALLCRRRGDVRCYRCEALVRDFRLRGGVAVCVPCAADWDRMDAEMNETGADRCPPRE